MNRVELLAPAGDLEKLKIAYLYGADACYIGGKSFSLRARANNFTNDDIIEGCKFAHSLNKKLYVTMNIVPHDSDLSNLEEYLLFLDENKIDGIIVSSLYIAKKAIKICKNLEVHLSTQASISNSEAIKYYDSLGFKRVVLAREASLDEIKDISCKTNIELEVFIHGGMCVSYSGRCMLSNYLTNRDANRGGCAHSCRWNYDLYDNDIKINKKYVNFGSKDLNAYKHIFDLINCGVNSLKIEGRMKSLYYIACIVRCYRNLIDDYYKYNGDISKVDFDYYKNEIIKTENRVTSYGFLNGPVKKSEQLYNVRTEEPTKDFLGMVKDVYNDYIILEQRNYFKLGDSVEFIGPNLKNTKAKIIKILDSLDNEVSICNHPLEILKVWIDKDIKLSKNDIMRK